MANNIYGFIALTGGTPGALDKIDGFALGNKDIATGKVDGENYDYFLDATSGLAANPPFVIIPIFNAGLKRWILTKVDGGVW